MPSAMTTPRNAYITLSIRVVAEKTGPDRASPVDEDRQPDQAGIPASSPPPTATTW